MNPLLERISRPQILWITFAATILVTVAFAVLRSLLGITFIDGIASPADARATIAGFSALQSVQHAWITGTLDVAYPLAYGALFAGSAMRFFPRWGGWLALPGILAIPVDLFEGVVQILALTHVVDWLALKAFVTPLKSGLFLAGLAITIAGWISWLVGRGRSRTSGSSSP